MEDTEATSPLLPVQCSSVQLNANCLRYTEAASMVTRKITCLCLHGSESDGRALSCLSVGHSESCHGSLLRHLTGGVT